LTIPTADGDLLHYSAVASEPLESASKAPVGRSWIGVMGVIWFNKAVKIQILHLKQGNSAIHCPCWFMQYLQESNDMLNNV